MYFKFSDRNLNMLSQTVHLVLLVHYLDINISYILVAILKKP